MKVIVAVHNYKQQNKIKETKPLIQDAIKSFMLFLKLNCYQDVSGRSKY